jgi:thiol-disulfide isomerase/thioredoxin
MTILIFFMFLLKYSISLKEWWEDTAALELKSDNYWDIVGKEKYVVVKFYTKWCKYCREMAPEYEKIVDLLKKRKDVIVARLDGGTHEDVVVKYGIYSFPVVVLFEPGSVNGIAVYQGERKVNLMSKWVEINAPPLDEAKPSTNTTVTTKTASDSKVDINNEILTQVNKTDVTPELEFIKNEIVSLKSKIDSIEKEILTIKDLTKNITITNEEDSDSDIEKKVTPWFDDIKMPSPFSIVVACSGISVLLALAITIKRIFSKTLKNAELHDKV